MNAIEFVKNHGIKEAIKVVELHPVSTLINISGSCVSILDLKQIVDAFELVEKVGGLDNAKTFDESCMYCIEHLTTLGNLKQAINLVEKCQND